MFRAQVAVEFVGSVCYFRAFCRVVKVQAFFATFSKAEIVWVAQGGCVGVQFRV